MEGARTILCFDFKGSIHDRYRQVLDLEPEAGTNEARCDFMRNGIRTCLEGRLNIEILQNLNGHGVALGFDEPDGLLPLLEFGRILADGVEKNIRVEESEGTH